MRHPLAAVVHDQANSASRCLANISRPYSWYSGRRISQSESDCKGVAFSFQLLFERAEAVQLAVADHAVGAAEEGLHPLRRQAHDGQPAKAQQAELVSATRWSSGPRDGAQQILGKLFFGQIMPGITHTQHIW